MVDHFLFLAAPFKKKGSYLSICAAIDGAAATTRADVVAANGASGTRFLSLYLSTIAN